MFFFFLFFPSRQWVWIDWKNLFVYFFPFLYKAHMANIGLINIICRLLWSRVLSTVINSNGGFKQAHREFCSSTTKNISPLPHCLWATNFAGRWLTIELWPSHDPFSIDHVIKESSNSMETKTTLSTLPQCLWPPNLAGRWLNLRGSYPWSYELIHEVMGKLLPMNVPTSYVTS